MCPVSREIEITKANTLIVFSSSHQEGVFPPKEGVTGFLFFYDDGHLAVSRDVSMGDTDGQKLPS